MGVSILENGDIIEWMGSGNSNGVMGEGILDTDKMGKGICMVLWIIGMELGIKASIWTIKLMDSGVFTKKMGKLSEGFGKKELF